MTEQAYTDIVDLLDELTIAELEELESEVQHKKELRECDKRRSGH